jgi:hypothetical protein
MIPCSTKVWRPSKAAEAIYEQKKPVFNKRSRELNARDALPYEVMLGTFGELPQRHPQRHEFLILLWLEQWGDKIQLESGGVLNHWAVRMAKAYCHFNRVNLMGCGSSGKTALASAYLYTLWKSRPFNTSIFLSTTSGEAAQSRTWGQIKDWHTSDRFSVGKRIESLHLITLDDETKDEEGQKKRDFRNSIKVVLIKTGSEGKNAMAGIVGRKNDYVVWCVDEFPFMDVGVLDARVNLNNNPFHQFIGLGNAPEEGDPMYQDSTPFGPNYPDGWRSVDKDKDLGWPTEKGYCLYFNGATSPNFTVNDGVTRFPKLMNAHFQKEVLRDSGGEDSPMYWKQFYGFPPTVDISDKVLTHKLLDTQGAFLSTEWQDTNQKVLAGLDLGFRSDGDPCVIHFGKIGRNVRGRNVLNAEPDSLPLLPKSDSKEAFEPQIAKRVIQECRSRGCKDIALDVTGDGGIMLQHIEREARAQSYTLNVAPVSFSGLAEDRIVIPGEQRTGREMFGNMVGQLWISARVCVLNSVINGLSEHGQCAKQLCSRRLGSDDKKRQTVEKKSEMKKRLRRSPDHADSFVLLVHLSLKHGLDGQEIKSVPKPFDPLDYIRKKTGQKYNAPQRSVYGGR